MTRFYQFLAILIVYLMFIPAGLIKAESKINNDQIPLSSYQFEIGSNIVKIAEYVESKTGESKLKYPILQKNINGEKVYFVAEDDIYTLFDLWQVNYPSVKNPNKEIEPWWFSPNHLIIHFKWKSDGSYDQEVFTNQEKVTWSHTPHEAELLLNDRVFTRTIFPIDTICQLLHSQWRVEENGTKIIIRDVFGKTQTITIGSLAVPYEQTQGWIEYDYYLNTPITIKDNRSIIDIQPLLFGGKFPTYSEKTENYQYKPYYWEIYYNLRDKKNNRGMFIGYAYSMPGKERIWTDDYIVFDNKEIRWLIKPLIVGKNVIHGYELTSNILVSLRTYFEMVGYEVFWDQAKNRISAKPIEGKR